ncbi:class II fructose-bisphosphatase [Minwuia thermotolerans]|uniref:class II fructose-bisphosphatase n=1 Tax=Minwuia thermotolerans TaxID=2056226 RepID=UPI0024057014|nr:class II fructose-bisphosphatase [Minwuia thermotolerans]
MSKTTKLDRNLTLEAVRVTEAGAIASFDWIGMGNEKQADQAAVDAMRTALNGMAIRGTVVIGEGERDEAPMLYIGEDVGNGHADGIGPEIDIALDPLEGTTITAKAAPGSLSVMALSEKGMLLNSPDVYMDKIAVGGGLPDGVVDLDRSVTENLTSLAAAKGCAVADLMICILDRPRHSDIIKETRAAGARIQLIPDGDIAGVIATTDPETRIDMYIGTGGAPEGVLAAAALRCVGGQMQGRLIFRNNDEKERARRIGITDLDRKYEMEEMAAGDVIFTATGVTDGGMLRGVRRHSGVIVTDSVVMRSKTGTVRRIEGRRRIAS